jgi:uncharacterized protein (TIGR03435 family)
MLRACSRVCCLAAAASVLFAQSFEAVSVKPSRVSSTGSDTGSDHGIFKARNVSLQRLIALAWGMEDYRVEGPAWLGAQRYDVDAKYPADAPRGGPEGDEVFRAMMRNVLATRFRVVAHRSQKTFAVYELHVAKSGLKIKEVQGGVAESSGHHNQYSGTRVSMSGFARFLSGRADLPVVDMTGLDGYYTFTLEWPLLAGESAPWEALQEAMESKLGLRCENRKTQLDIVVVDHAEKTPTAD